MTKIFKIKLNKNKELFTHNNVALGNSGCGCGNNNLNNKNLENKTNNKKENLINNLNKRKLFI
jgi:hypothetical protein